MTKRKGPPGPASGFGKEKTPADYRARIKWEKWAAAEQRRSGSEAHATGHDLARARYEDMLRGSAKKKAAKGGVRRISTMSGYAYEYEGKGDPLRGKDDDWQIGLIDAEPAQLLGTRKIDGADHYVMRLASGAVVAQTTASLK